MYLIHKDLLFSSYILLFLTKGVKGPEPLRILEPNPWVLRVRTISYRSPRL